MKGLTVMTGDGGTGKTLLARRLLNGLEEEVFEAGLMVMLPGAAEAGHVLQRFARQLGVESPGEDRATLMVQIYEMLAAVREEGRHSVLILDDAHVLGPGQMAEIGSLLNLEYEDRRLLSMLLVGLPILDESLLRDAALESRVDVRVRLQPLDAENASAYLGHRLQLAGGRPEILSAEAMQQLFVLGRGRPRLMNTLADNALFEAFLAKRASIAARDVVRAAADLGLTAESEKVGQPGAKPAAESTPALRMDEGLAGTDSEGSFELELSSPEFENSAADLGTLLTAPEVVDEFSTLLIDETEGASSSTIDLDDEVEAALNDASVQDSLPNFHAQNASHPASAEATRRGFPDEGPPKDQTSDELDDLFVELIED